MNLQKCKASEIAQRVRTGELSAVEVASEFLDRNDDLNQTINAIVQDTRELALAQAAEVDADVRAGNDPGPLAGVPITIKVNVDQEGLATTNGLRLQSEKVALASSPFIDKMANAGAVVVGRTNTPAFSLRWFTNNDLHGQTLNPHNPAITPGGSSGGAAAAVASGMCTIGHGTDIAGSIRYPAYACGVHGLRPTFGRVPTFNATSGDRFVGGQVMAVSGPIARTIDDVRLGLLPMSGMDPRDPWSVDAPFNLPFKKRAALCIEPDGLSVSPHVAETLKRAARSLADHGWEIEEAPCPPVREAAEINTVLWMAETSFAAGKAMEDEGNTDAQFVYEQMCRAAGPIDLERVMKALQRRATLIRAWEEFFTKYPLLICPVSGELPFDQQLDVRSEDDFARVFEAQLTQRGLPVMGMPALSVATGFVGSHPVGVQLVSGRFREDILFDAGTTLEAAFGAPELPQQRDLNEGGVG